VFLHDQSTSYKDLSVLNCMQTWKQGVENNEKSIIAKAWGGLGRFINQTY